MNCVGIVYVSDGPYILWVSQAGHCWATAQLEGMVSTASGWPGTASEQHYAVEFGWHATTLLAPADSCISGSQDGIDGMFCGSG